MASENSVKKYNTRRCGSAYAQFDSNCFAKTFTSTALTTGSRTLSPDLAELKLRPLGHLTNEERKMVPGIETDNLI